MSGGGGADGSESPRGSPAGSLTKKHHAVLQRVAAADGGGGSQSDGLHTHGQPDRKVSRIQMGKS